MTYCYLILKNENTNKNAMTKANKKDVKNISMYFNFAPKYEIYVLIQNQLKNYMAFLNEF